MGSPELGVCWLEMPHFLICGIWSLLNGCSMTTKLFCDHSQPVLVVHTREFLSPICCLSFDEGLVGSQEEGNTQEHLQC